MDPHTLDKLEFEAVRELLADQVNCGLGRQMAEKIKPVNRADLIAGWHAQVRELRDAAATLDLPPFGGVHDIREAVRVAVPPHVLEPEEFCVVADTLSATRGIVAWADRLPTDATALRSICERIGDFSSIADAIHRVIDQRGEVRDDASAKLSRIRSEISSARMSISRVIDRLLRERDVTRFLRYPDATFHNDRYVLPLAAEHRGRLKGIVHRSSDSGATLFVEPAEAVELNNRIIDLKNDERGEIGRLLWHLTHQLHLNQEAILSTLDALAILDLIVAKVRLARTYDLHCPAVNEDGVMRLRHARHPLLVKLAKERRQQGRPMEVVPIDVRLGDDFDVLIITGPNTGGKTVALKTVGLACLMNQAGLPIPAADGSTLPVFRDLLVDIGDEQSLEQSLSTFSAHLAQLMLMLRRAKSNTLMLIDELGAGTDPDEGAALGQSIVEELLERRCPAIVTTHLGSLKALAFIQARAENACVDFDSNTLQPTYRLLIGEPGNSNAINIASKLGLPDKIVKRARGHLSQAHQQLTRAIRGTLVSRREAERARTEAEEAQRQAEQQRQAAERERRDLETKKIDFERWVQAIAALRPGDTVHVRRFDREGRIVRVHLTKQVAVVNVGSMEMEVPIRELSLPTASAQK